MSTIKVNKIENTATADGGISIDASGHVEIDGVQLPNAGALSSRNRIINGDFRVDQRNDGSAVTSPSGGNAYVMDRWFIGRFNDTTGTFTCERSTTTAGNFVNSAKVSVTAAQSSVPSNAVYGFTQAVEGLNVGDLAFGTSAAQYVTLSFNVRSSVTGTFAGRLYNSANNRSYIFQYTISSANTFEYKTVSIPGDTSGTWLTTNGIGIGISFDLGYGTNFEGTANAWQAGEKVRASGNVRLINTNSATWFVAGVQLEVGEKATPFEHRSYGDELQRCLRYYNRVAEGFSHSISNMAIYQDNNAYGTYTFPVAMRAAPSVDATDVTGHFKLFSVGSADSFDTITIENSRTNSAEFRATASNGLSGASAGDAAFARVNDSAAYVALSAEL